MRNVRPQSLHEKQNRVTNFFPTRLSTINLIVELQQRDRVALFVLFCGRAPRNKQERTGKT